MIKKFLYEDNIRFNKNDFLSIFIIIFIYGLVSFINLGNYNSPQTFYSAKKNENIVFELEKYDKVDFIMLFNGYDNSKYQVYASMNNRDFYYIDEFNGKGSFAWDKRILSNQVKYIRIKFIKDSTLGEVAFYNEEGNYLAIKSVTNSNGELINELKDESDVVPTQISYMNSSYFDEIYFARTAYEYAHNIKTYEWTHPPLGKIIQMIPIVITNNFSPFTYRFMGNISGILMIFVMYLFGKKLFKYRKYAILCSLILCFDTFHFAQTRMGTVDSHLVLFILLAVYFMYEFIGEEKVRYLFLSGLMFALSISVKWTGFYGGLGLAIVYFLYLFKNKKFNTEYIVKGSVFFVVIPLIIYCSIYLLFPNNLLYTNNLKNIKIEQKKMYIYHSRLEEGHAFSSKWYTWPFSYKPVWYHQEIYNSQVKETISGVGNLIIWIMSIFGIIYSFLKCILKKDKISLFLIIIFLSLWLPYAFIGRVMFLYHYFPALLFAILCLVNLLKDINEDYDCKYIIPIFLLLSIIFFIIYYPVVSGMPISREFVDKLDLFNLWCF